MLKKRPGCHRTRRVIVLKAERERPSPGGRFGGERSHVELVPGVEVHTSRERDYASKDRGLSLDITALESLLWFP